MQLKTEVTGEEVAEAHALFSLSTMKTITEKDFVQNFGQSNLVDLEKAQEFIRKRMCIGNQSPISNLLASLPNQLSESIVQHAIDIMIKNG